jgi:adenylate kinase family enzyme
MTEVEKSKKNLIILLIPPLLNYVDWKKDSKNQYFFLEDIVNPQEKLTTWQKQSSLLQRVEDLNKKMIYDNKIIETLTELNSGQVILVNYPRNKESLQTLEKELWIRGQKQPIFFFVSFSKKLEVDFAELQTENIICPFCERSWRKKETISERENIFRCPEDKLEFSLAETEKITQYLLSDYFEKAAQIIEYEHQKAKKNKIITLELSIKPDFEPENLRQYLLEKLEKETFKDQ